MDALRNYWTPEESARFDRLWALVQAILIEKDALAESASEHTAELEQALDDVARLIYGERQRLLDLAAQRARSGVQSGEAGSGG